MESIINKDGIFDACKFRKIDEKLFSNLINSCPTKYCLLNKKKNKYFNGKQLVDSYLNVNNMEKNQENVDEALLTLKKFFLNKIFISINLRKKQINTNEFLHLKRANKNSRLKQISCINKNDSEEEIKNLIFKKLATINMNNLTFKDSENDFYVWNYKPVNTLASYGISIAFVVAILFYNLTPIWPKNAQEAFQYGFYALIALLVVFMALAVVRYIIFSMIFVLSFFKWKFWLFPNLTEDCGVIDSFLPIYTLEYVTKQPTKNRKIENGEKKSFFETIRYNLDYIFKVDDEEKALFENNIF